MGNKRRENKARQRARWRADKAATARIASESNTHVLDSVEYGAVFLVRGGREHIGECLWVARDSRGKAPNKPVVDGILGITRDKASKLMAFAETARAIRVIRENLREERKQKQVARILQAHDRGVLSWQRQEVPDQAMRSVLVGSSKGCPEAKSDSLVVCFRQDGRYIIATETWGGVYSLERERVGVELEVMEDVSFHDEKEAQRAFMFAIRMGEQPGFEATDPAFAGRMADRLLSWEHDGRDMKAERERLRKPKREKLGKRARRVRLPV